MSPARRLADPGQRFLAKLIGLALAGLAIRLVYGFSLGEPGGDATFYHQVAGSLADGDGFVSPVLGSATAAHPPLFPFLLAIGSLLGATSTDAHQAIGCAIGASAVVAIGLAGRQLAGPGVGLVAGALAAVYPPLLANDSLMLSESAYELTIALTILAALRLLELPSRGRAVLLGAAIGLAALARAEALLLILLLGLPLALRLDARRLATFALICAGAAALVLPWSARNLIVFDRFVLISTNDGSVISGANCASTYGPRLRGAWDLGCSLRAATRSGDVQAEERALEEALRGGTASDELAARLRRAEGGNEAVVAARQRRRGLDYARDHSGQVPAVVAARVGRTLSLYRVREQVRTNRFFRGSPDWLEWLTVVSFYVAALLAAAGAAALWRRRGELLILAAPLVLVVITSALGFGTPRFRAAAEVAIVLLASVALGRALSARRPAG